MEIQPTEEFRPFVPDRQTAARKEVANTAVAFYRMAQTEDGKRVLDFLDRFVNRPIPFEQLPHGAVHKEGQCWVLHEIRAQISQGERTLHGS